MNPKVADMASKIGFDAAYYTWFDFTDLSDGYEQELEAVGKQHNWHSMEKHLDDFLTPSDHMAVMHPNLENAVFTYDKYVKIGNYEGAAIMMWIPHGNDVPYVLMTERPVRASGYDFVDEGDHRHIVLHKHLMDQSIKDGQTKNDALSMYQHFCLSAVNTACLMNLRAHTTEQVLTAHIAKGMEFINKKRKAKREPMLYSWNTIELKPQPQVKNLEKTGTHASPARHKRRAHMRRLRLGGFTWIPEMWVGNIENGMIVHDYVSDRELTKINQSKAS
jgi:hypothetical protein